MITSTIKKIRKKFSEMEIRQSRTKAQRYRDEAAKELNLHMKAAFESIACNYDARADKAEESK